MAKKITPSKTSIRANSKKVLNTEDVQAVYTEPIKVETVVEKEKTKAPSNTWEIKDRTYILKGNNQNSLFYALKSSSLKWFDEEKGYERELKYTSNQKTPFVDEFVGSARLAHIIFEDGMLYVPKNKQTLQKLLSLYHPSKDTIYFEKDNVKEAVNELYFIELEIEALMTAQNMDIDIAEAIMRVELGSKVSTMNSKELKRDLLVFAKTNPELFLELANDENVHLRNIGIKAIEMGIIKLSQDNRTFMWSSNDRKLMTVPFDEHPYSALAAWFKTDEGMEVFGSIEKRLK
jgi:hypothetical protein